MGDFNEFIKWRDPMISWASAQEMFGSYKTSLLPPRSGTSIYEQVFEFTDTRDAVLFKTTWSGYRKSLEEDADQ